MVREIVNIDEELCNGCGDCVPNCHEGALQIIDDKAIEISDINGHWQFLWVSGGQ